MQLDDYQKKATKTNIYLNKIKENFPNLPKEIYKMLGLSYVCNGLGEVGEIQGKFKKIIRDNGGIITDEHRKEISKEIGDNLWYIASLCTELNISLDECCQQNLRKLNSRKERGKLEGSGDNR